MLSAFLHPDQAYPVRDIPRRSYCSTGASTASISVTIGKLEILKKFVDWELLHQTGSSKDDLPFLYIWIQMADPPDFFGFFSLKMLTDKQFFTLLCHEKTPLLLLSSLNG